MILTAPNRIARTDDGAMAEPWLSRIFIAGGITDCPDWQAEFMPLIDGKNVVLLNPRRPDFNVRQKGVEDEQIAWEFDMLKTAHIVSFWFPCETLCPITLYELGVLSAAEEKEIVVGCHPDYARRSDVLIQTKLRRPEVRVRGTLRALADDVKAALDDVKAVLFR